MKIINKLLLAPKDFKPSLEELEIDGVLNPAAIRLPNKKIMLYVRVAESYINRDSKKPWQFPIIISKDNYETISEEIPEEEIESRDRNVIYLKSGICRLTNISHFRKVILKEDGFKVESISQTPDFTGIPGDEEYGVEDPRITKIGSNYLMTYVSISKKNGISTSLVLSSDLKKWKRKGIIFSEQNKDCVLFPEKIDGKYVAFHRPETLFEFSKPGIWISHSKDLIYWGKEQSVLKPRLKSWESERVGSGAPPIKTEKGWLLLYHGVYLKNEKVVYSVGAALFDLKHPEKIIARSPQDKPLIKPLKPYEKKGYTSNVIFPTGAIQSLNKKDLVIYSGGADSVVSVQKIAIKDILKSMEYY